MRMTNMIMARPRRETITPTLMLVRQMARPMHVPRAPVDKLAQIIIATLGVVELLLTGGQGRDLDEHIKDDPMSLWVAVSVWMLLLSGSLQSVNTLSLLLLRMSVSVTMILTSFCLSGNIKGGHGDIGDREPQDNLDLH